MWPGGTPRTPSHFLFSIASFGSKLPLFKTRSAGFCFALFFLYGEQKQILKHVGHSERFLPHRLKATQWNVNRHASVFHCSRFLFLDYPVRLFNPKLVLVLFFISPLSSKVKQDAALFTVKKTNKLPSVLVVKTSFFLFYDTYVHTGSVVVL